jgi:hypothetical protein
MYREQSRKLVTLERRKMMILGPESSIYEKTRVDLSGGCLPDNDDV